MPKPIKPEIKPPTSIITGSGKYRNGLVQDDGCIGAECEECRRAKIHIAGVSAKDIPGCCQHNVLQNHIAGEEHVGIID